jgi:hypothetical protein
MVKQEISDKFEPIIYHRPSATRAVFLRVPAHGNAVGFRIDCKVAAVNGGAFPLVFVRFFACFTALAADVSDYQNHPHDLCPYKFCGLPVPVLPDGYRVALAQPQGGADYTACH